MSCCTVLLKSLYCGVLYRGGRRKEGKWQIDIVVRESVERESGGKHVETTFKLLFSFLSFHLVPFELYGGGVDYNFFTFESVFNIFIFFSDFILPTFYSLLVITSYIKLRLWLLFVLPYFVLIFTISTCKNRVVTCNSTRL